MPRLIARLLMTCLTLTLSALWLAPAQALEDFTPTNNWYGVYVQGQKVGFAQIGQRLIQWETQEVIETYIDTTMVIRMLGVEKRMDIREHEYTAAADLALLGYDTFIETGLPGMDQNTRVRRVGDEIVVESIANGQVTGTRRIPFNATTMQSSYAVSKQMRSQFDPALGGTTRVTIFDPTSLAPVIADFEIGPAQPFYYNGVTVEAHKITNTIASIGITQESMETLDGLVMRTSALGGMFDMRLEDELIAKSQEAIPDLMATSKVEITGIRIPLQPVAHLEVHPLIEDDIAELFPTTARQRITGTIEDPVLTIDMLGPGQGPQVVLTPPELVTYLGSSLYVQPFDPKMKAQAATILEGVPDDPLARAFAIVDWVWTHVSKEFVPTTPNALQVLDTMKGDCGEHAVLTAALLRAARLPAKVNYGLVFTPEYGQGFFFHAWNSVLIEDRWLEVDSALGMFPADATHVTIGEGDDPGSSLAILRLYGRLGFDVRRALSGEFEERYRLKD